MTYSACIEKFLKEMNRLQNRFCRKLVFGFRTVMNKTGGPIPLVLIVETWIDMLFLETSPQLESSCHAFLETRSGRSAS